MFAALTVWIGRPAAAQNASDTSCLSIIYSGGDVAIPGANGNLEACNIQTETCVTLHSRNGVASGRLAAIPDQIISFTGKDLPHACVVSVKREASPWASALPSFVVGIVGFAGALLGSWFNARLARLREQEKAVVRWRVEMIERLEPIAASGGEIARLGYIRDADEAVFEAIYKIKTEVERQAGNAPLNASSTARAEYATKLLSLLQDKSP